MEVVRATTRRTEEGMEMGTRTVICAVVFLGAAISVPVAAASQHKPIDVYLDGKRVTHDSGLLRSDITAGVVLGGRSLVAQRFLREALDVPSETCLLKCWGVFQLGQYYFKVGSPKVIRSVAIPGGGGFTTRTMPAAPTILKTAHGSRLYVPADPVLGLFGYGIKWRADEGALHIRTGGATFEQKNYMY
jgi:hypothetical protein